MMAQSFRYVRGNVLKDSVLVICKNISIVINADFCRIDVSLSWPVMYLVGNFLNLLPLCIGIFVTSVFQRYIIVCKTSCCTLMGWNPTFALCVSWLLHMLFQFIMSPAAASLCVATHPLTRVNYGTRLWKSRVSARLWHHDCCRITFDSL